MDSLTVFFEHHIWATRELIEYCQTLTEPQLEFSIPGTYGAIVPTLTHILAEDQRLLERLTGEAAAVRVREEEIFTLDQLQEIWTVQTARWRDVIARVESLTVTLPARDPWPEVVDAKNLVLLEAIQHGNDHRTHVCSVLGAHGITVPYLCGWMFWRSTGRISATAPA